MKIFHFSKKGPVGERIESIDIYRGFVIIIMVFANASTRMDLPWWMVHAGLTERGPEILEGRFFDFTWPDTILRSFLFVMGMSIPLALERRLSKAPLLHCSGHVLKRGLLLMWLGGVLYGTGVEGPVSGVPLKIWVSAGFAALCALLMNWPDRMKELTGKRYLGRLLLLAGVVYFIIATFLFEDGQGRPFFNPERFPFSILGWLGFGYLFSAFIWMLTRRKILLRAFVYILSLLFVFHLRQGDTFLGQLLQPVTNYLSLRTAVIRGSMVLAGTFIGDAFLARNSGKAVFRSPGAFVFAVGSLFWLAALILHRGFFEEFAFLRTDFVRLGLSAFTFWFIFQIDCFARKEGPGGLLRRPFALTGRNALFAYSLQFGLGGFLAILVRNEEWVRVVRGYTIFGAEGWLGLLYTALPFTAAVVCLTCLTVKHRLLLKL